MESQLRELLGFLRDRNPQVRQLALSGLLPQTAKDAPHRALFFTGLSTGLQKPKENDIIRDLKLLCRDQLSVAHDAFRALVNLSDSALVVTSLSEKNFMEFIVSYIIHPDSILADLAAMILSNITASSTACALLLSLKVPVIPVSSIPSGVYATQSRCGSSPAPVPYPSASSQDVLALPLLLDAFVQGAHLTDDLSKRTRKADLHFLASVFANLTTSAIGRDFFFTPRETATSVLEYPLTKLVPFTEHKDTIRRGGVASAIKSNCAFNAAAHRALLEPESIKVAVPPSHLDAPGIGALPYILLPLAGPEEFDLEDQDKLPEALQLLPPTKTREPDETLRLSHVETLLLLCHTRWGRDFLRDHGVYEIVRATHENETIDKISEHIERLVNLLKGVEPEHNIDVNVEVGADGAILEQGQHNSDDEDSRIEEV